MLPSAGRGALNAMLDSVVVANAIYEMTSFSNLDQVQKGFKSYYVERYPHAASEISSSKQMARVTSGAVRHPVPCSCFYLLLFL